MDETREWLRPIDIAARLGVTRSRIYQLIGDGHLPAVRRGRAICIPRAAWERWLESQRDQALAAVKPSNAASGHGSTRLNTGSRGLESHTVAAADRGRQAPRGDG